jgi:hypothetical protein
LGVGVCFRYLVMSYDQFYNVLTDSRIDGFSTECLRTSPLCISDGYEPKNNEVIRYRQLSLSLILIPNESKFSNFWITYWLIIVKRP